MAKFLYFRPSKTFKSREFSGRFEDYRICAEIALHDDCKNGVCEFHLVGDIYDFDKRKKDNCVTCGCIHEHIAKHFPDLAKFIPLHCCNYLGQPLYPVDNGLYYLKQGVETGDFSTVCKQMRITPGEAAIMSDAARLDDKKLFKYWLFGLGIVARWKQEADEFIKYLEEKTGQTWENPYKEDHKHFVLSMSDDERLEVQNLIISGYYKKDAIDERLEAARQAAKDKKRDEVITKYEKAVEKYTMERDIFLLLIDNDIPTKNVIYYDFCGKVGFNWSDCYGDKKMSDDEINKAVSLLSARFPHLKFENGKKEIKI